MEYAGYRSREQAARHIIERMEGAKEFVNKKKNISLKKLCKLYDVFTKKYGRIDMFPDFLADTFIGDLHDRHSHKVIDTLNNIEMALDLCVLRKAKDTDFFKNLRINKQLVNKYIDLKIKQEAEHNKEVEKTGIGYESYIWARIDDNNIDHTSSII